ncbi:MAG: hypothetical protein JJ863_33835 [Deltaproteobacteria bacterium]|nr:hypothetical protein [Deltaproteobacteria bacterium]
MSTKRLARTVIEGGRARYNTDMRRHSHRVHRRREREYLRSLELEPELADSLSPPVLDWVGKWHWDRLSAAERWLAHRAGRPWRVVEGEILATFDTRSIAGQHVVFDHLLPSGWRFDREGCWWVNRRIEFHVDDGGLLVAEQMKRRPTPWRWRCRLDAIAEGRLSCTAVRFVGDGRIGLRGGHAYWMHPTEPFTAAMERCRRYLERPLPFRQGRPLTEVERAAYDALSAPERVAITITLE